MTESQITSDYRVQELMGALNEGILELEFVKARLEEWAGEQIDLVRYSDGKYGIVTIEN